MADYYCHVDTSEQYGRLRGLKSELLQSFGAFNTKAFEEGALSQKVKELIAVAAAHITRCPYCIPGHTKRAKQFGVTDEEIAEAIFVAVR